MIQVYNANDGKDRVSWIINRLGRAITIVEQPINLYFVFILILSTIFPCTTGLKALYDPPTVQVQSNSQVTDIPLTERQSLKDDHLSTSLRFFNLPLGIGPNDRVQF